MPPLAMSREDYSKMIDKQTRYGHSYDQNVDDNLPILPIKNKKGTVTRRRRRGQKKQKSYWKSQCSFRKLSTKGNIDDLQASLQSRDKSQDSAIEDELKRIKSLIDAEDDRYWRNQERLEEERHERWWKEAGATFEQKVAIDMQRALTERLEYDKELRKGCHTIKAAPNYSQHWLDEQAAQGFICQGVYSPEDQTVSLQGPQPERYWTIVGEASAVETRVQEIKIQKAKFEADKEAHEKAEKEAARQARKAALKAKIDAVVTEAKQLPDWDLTGTWMVDCPPLKEQYSTQRLKMEISQDSYDMNRTYDSDDDDDRSADDEREYYRINEDSDDEWAKTKPRLKRKPVPSTHLMAKFDFGMLEGCMRIYPKSTTQHIQKPFKFKENPAFEYRWRGRAGEDMGSSEIQCGADKAIQQIIFSEHGTSFAGTFICDYLEEPVMITGRKIRHGRGQKGDSGRGWAEMDDREWDRECVTRWGRGYT